MVDMNLVDHIIVSLSIAKEDLMNKQKALKKLFN